MAITAVQDAAFRPRVTPKKSSDSRPLFLSFILSVLELTTAHASSERDSTHHSDMYSTTANSLNHRPRGFSTNNHIHPTIDEQPYILPQFLRRLSSGNSFREDSYDRAEKMVNGGAAGMFGNRGGRLRFSFGWGTGGMKGRLFKILAIALVFFTVTYVLLPWSSSFAPLERTSFQYPG